MKIDRANVGHWGCLVLFGLNVLAAMLLRPLRRRRKKRMIVFYGHKLAGNLLAIHHRLRTRAASDVGVAFLTMDKIYHRQLLASGVTSVLATRPGAARLLSCTDAIISDHGLHVMSCLAGRSGIKFFDVWHGIPFKGFDADDFRTQHRYDEVWVASPLMKKLYVECYGFGADKVIATGYARTDRLVRQGENIDVIKRELGLDGPGVGKIVLFAPTWKQDAQNRSLVPFGVDESTFLHTMSALAGRAGATFVMRTHLNSGVRLRGEWERIEYRPFAEYPDTEQWLLISDILVCDWSSIAFDYLLLERPTLFLDVEPPFAKGFSLGPEYRFGEIIKNLDGLAQALERYLRHPEQYGVRHGARAAEIRRSVYGGYADGEATARCISRLNGWLVPGAGISKNR